MKRRDTREPATPPRWVVFCGDDPVERSRGMRWALDNGYDWLLLLRMRYVVKARPAREGPHAGTYAELDRLEKIWRTEDG